MNFSSVVIVTGMAAIASLSAAAPVAESAVVEQPAPKSIEELIDNLRNESYRIREQATRVIWAMGEGALPALKEAAASKDPEQVTRARDLLRKIQLHITPDTDPSVIALVERYIKGSVEEKASILGRLKGKRAWRQMLKLYAGEATAEAREKLRTSLNGIAVRAATERLSQGKPDEAREFLEMAPADSEGLLALAEFHRNQGTLPAELEKAKVDGGKKSLIWQIALHRAAGDVAAAREAAEAAGETEIAAVMSVLSGDPLPWLRMARFAVNETSVASAYSAAAIKLWQGKKLRNADFEKLSGYLDGRNRSERTAAMSALFLLGEIESAEAVFAKAAPLQAFHHFEALERIPEALTALGLDPAGPDYRTWVEKRVGKLGNDDIEDQRGASSHAEELVSLANFLERRGQHAETLAAFGEPLAKLAEKDVNAFVDFLGSLFGGSGTLTGAPFLAKRVAVSWAGDEDKRWDEVVVAALGDDEQYAEWWENLGDISPKSTRPERLDGMLALFGLGSDPSKLRGKWLDLVWKDVEAAQIGRRDALVERISTLSIQVGDVINSLKAWEMLPENARAEVFWGQHIVHLSAAGRWGEAADTILKQIALLSDARQDPVAELHAYAASALRQAGREDEAATHEALVNKLFLGSANLAVRIGNGYAYGVDYKRAGAWWTRAAILADPNSGDFADALKLHADALLEQGQWRETAAASEVLARIYADSNLIGTSPLLLMRQRLQSDMARALANLKTDRAGSLAILAKCHRDFASDGSLADFFFPAIRREGLIQEHDKWFNDSWNRMEKMISLFPDSDNTRNTAAWFASRALRKLDEATRHLEKALAANPDQPAYLDTMAEIQFARGNREKALEWSAIAVNFAPADSQLRRQQARFRFDPLPK